MSRIPTRLHLPPAPAHWDPASKQTWTALINALEASHVDDAGRRTRPEFRIVGQLPLSPVTVNTSLATVTQLRRAVGLLLFALDKSKYIELSHLSAAVSLSSTFVIDDGTPTSDGFLSM